MITQFQIRQNTVKQHEKHTVVPEYYSIPRRFKVFSINILFSAATIVNTA